MSIENILTLANKAIEELQKLGEELAKINAILEAQQKQRQEDRLIDELNLRLWHEQMKKYDKSQ